MAYRYSCKRSTLELVRQCCVDGNTARAIEILDMLMDDEARRLLTAEKKEAAAVIEALERRNWNPDEIAEVRLYLQELNSNLL